MSNRVVRPVSRELFDLANAVFGEATYDYARNGGNNGNTARGDRAMQLPLDVWTDEHSFVISAYLPGLDPDGVEITMEGEELTIRGEFPGRQEGEGIRYLRRELFHGKFERRLTFNVPVDVEGIEATFERGILMLTVPKAEESRPKQIKVQVK